MSSDRSAFLSAIIANPDDDTVRLVFADWLEEHDDPESAHRIRCMCASGWEIPNVSTTPQHRCLRVPHKETESFIIIPCLPVEAEWCRGFAETLRCTAADFLAHADDLVWHPGQTMECGNKCHDYCIGNPTTYVPVPGTNIVERCSVCAGTGCVPRPCPETAQPILRVVLTTWPELDQLAVGTDYVEFNFPGRPHRRIDAPGRVVIGQDILRVENAPWEGTIGTQTMLAVEWPGIEFELPSSSPLSGTHGTITIGTTTIAAGD